MLSATIVSWFSTYLLHPLSGNGYQWWSGAGSDLSEITLLGFALAAYRKHNCHHRGCPWLSWHPDPDTGHPRL